jgi:hypothetical protein
VLGAAMSSLIKGSNSQRHTSQREVQHQCFPKTGIADYLQSHHGRGADGVAFVKFARS